MDRGASVAMCQDKTHSITKHNNVHRIPHIPSNSASTLSALDIHGKCTTLCSVL